MKGNLKKKKVAHKLVQTDKEEDKPKVTVTDLTSDGVLNWQAYLIWMCQNICVTVYGFTSFISMYYV